MTAPSETEIRDSIIESLSESPPRGSTLAVEWSDVWSNWQAVSDDLYETYDRHGETLPGFDRLYELTWAALESIRDEVTPRIIDALVDAVSTYAAEHPDAPRREAVAT